MHTRPLRRIRLLSGASLLACAGLLAAAPGGPALAAAFQLKENSVVGLGTSFAGAGSAADTPATVFNNPAGMVQLPGLQVALGGSIIVPSFVFKGTARTALGTPIAGETERDGGNVAVVPHNFVTYRITPDLAVGLAVTVPYGLTTYYGAGWAGRYHAEKSDLRTFDFNPAVAYRVAPWLSVGAGISIQHARAVFSSALNSQAIGFAALGRLLPLPDGHFNLQGTNTSFGYNFGVLIEPAAGTRIGLTYRSRIQHDFEGEATYSLPAPLAANPRFRSGPGGAKLVLPDTAAVSVTQAFGPRWTGYLDVTWTNWSQFRNLTAARPTGEVLTTTPQNYRDSFSVALGASYQATEALTLRAGTAYDRTPVRDAFRTARVPDESRYWLSIGASYRVLPNTTLDAGYAHLFVNDSTINERSSTGDVLQGRFSNGVDILALGVRSSF